MDLYKNRDWLYNEYKRKAKSSAQIAIECGVSRSTIRYWLKKHGIPERFSDGMSVEQHKEVESFKNLIFWVLVIITIFLIIAKWCR